MSQKLKEKILENICYTELVYGRINKKLNTNLSKKEIEEFIFKSLFVLDIKFFEKIGKNFYAKDFKNKVKITINFNTFRVITVDKIV